MRDRDILLLLALPIGFALAGVRSEARPLYAARTGRTCAGCHVDPAGGGLRTGTGFRYAWNHHATVPEEEREPTIDPRIADGIRMGADLRTQYMHDAENKTRSRSTFLQMQATLYISGKINDRVSIVYANEQGRTLEGFALIGGLPFEGTLKVGRFRPAFGLEVEDHTTFTRDALGFGVGSEDTGVELSVAGGPRQLTIAVINGAPGGSGLDDNTQKGAVARASWRAARGVLGLSGYANSPGITEGDLRREYRYGAFGILQAHPLTFLLEYDRGLSRPRAGPDIEAEAAFWEVSYLFLQRLSAKVRLDRYDPNLEYAETARDRIALGFESDLLPLTRFLAFVRAMREYGTNEEGGREYGEARDTVEIIAQLHVSF